MIRFLLGDHRLTLLDGGRLWLDGGAMFGVVPRPLWERERAPDPRNRIELAMNLLLIEDGTRRILVDTGAGTQWDPKRRDMYGIGMRSPQEILAPAGLVPDDIDLVVNTHLHFDHAGGNTVPGPDGIPVAGFPRATYVVQAGDLEVARWGHERTRASYRPEDFEPLADEERFRLVDGETDLGRGVRVLPAPGHTPWMQVVLVETGDGTVAFLADLVPTASHVPFAWVMAYDLEPLRTIETKKYLLPRAAREGWRCVLEHDPVLPLAVLAEDAGRLTARPVHGEA